MKKKILSMILAVSMLFSGTGVIPGRNVQEVEAAGNVIEESVNPVLDIFSERGIILGKTVAEIGNVSSSVTGSLQMINGDNSGYREYDLTVKNNSGTEIKDWVAILTVNGTIYNISNSEQSWNDLSYKNSGNTITAYVYESNGKNLGAKIASGASAKYSKICFSASGEVSKVEIRYSTVADAFKEATGNSTSGGVSGGSTGGTTGGSSGGTSGGSTGGTGSGTVAGLKYPVNGSVKNLSRNETPVGIHGALSVKTVSGYKQPIIVDQNGDPFTLRGASTHGMHWGEMGPFVNKAAFQSLRDEWGVNMVRLVSYVTQGGYTQGSKSKLDNLIQNGVQYATELGMYALIDWHVHNENPWDNVSSAETFFDTYSKKYASYNNVIYEICNEPTNVVWYNGTGRDLYSYAKRICSIIRKNDPDAIIVCGTNTWSQDVDDVSAKPLKNDGFSNVMYTLHFYSGTHYNSIKDKLRRAVSAGTPVFVTEFGTCDASGNGGYDFDNATSWIELLDSYGISYCCWSLCNKDESASYLLPGSTKKSGWSAADLSPTGIWLVNTYRKRAEEEAKNVIKKVTTIKLTSSSLTLVKGRTYQLLSEVLPADAADKSVTWTSSDPSVVTVSSNGFLTAVGKGSAVITVAANDKSGVKATCSVTVREQSSADVTAAVKVSYRTHVQTYGWLPYVSNGDYSGTTGLSKRLEAIQISLPNNTDSSKLGIQYTTHCQTYGWLPWSRNGEVNGTERESKRLEAIKIQLVGSDKDRYDVYYRVHAQTYGWLNWAKNGEAAGTAGYSKRLEGIQIIIVKKGQVPGKDFLGTTSTNSSPYIYSSGSNNPSVKGQDVINVACRTHVQTYGWQGWKYNGAVSGTLGESKRLEAIDIKLQNQFYAGSIEYRTHVQTYGWLNWVKDGASSGTSGESKRLEAIQIRLTGEMARKYDVYYRVHAQNYGWLGWAKNGESAGTSGGSKRLESIQIVLVEKNGPAPAKTFAGMTQNNPNPYVVITK